MFSLSILDDPPAGTLGPHFKKHCYRTRLLKSSLSIVLTIRITYWAPPWSITLESLQVTSRHWSFWKSPQMTLICGQVRELTGPLVEKTTIFANISLTRMGSGTICETKERRMLCGRSSTAKVGGASWV